MLYKLRIFLPVLLFLVVSPALAYTSPGTPTNFVSDFANILTPEQENTLNLRLTSLVGDEGSEIAIVTVPNLGGDTIENYAVSLFAEWGIGKEAEDNGILILVSVQEREIRIEVGYGLEDTITDAQAYFIINNIITPAFKTGDYYPGISGAIDKVTEAITGSAVLPNTIDVAENGSSYDKNFGILIEMLIFLIIPILAMTTSFWLGGVIGVISGFYVGTLLGTFQTSIILSILFGIVGMLIDFIVSRGGFGGGSGRFGGRGGGFGGFGGGRSGGGGASGRW